MAIQKRRVDEDSAAETRDNVVEAPIQRRLSVSEILRNRRLECGLDIDHVAEVLRIRQTILTAIEDGQFDQLPGSAYAIGFVRSYATYLGLDAEALVLRFKAEVAEVLRKPNLHFPLPVNETQVPTGTIMLVAVLMAVAAYGGWYYYSFQNGRTAETVPSLPERLSRLATPEQLKSTLAAEKAAPQTNAVTPAAPASAPAPAAVAQIPAASRPPAPALVATTAVTTTPGTQSLAPVAAGDADGVPPVDTKPAAAPLSAPATPDLAQPELADGAKATQLPATYGAASAEARVVLKALTDSWIQVRDNQGNLLITRVLKPGDTYNVPNQLGLTMVTGNAGGIEIAVDGSAVSRIGEEGQVVRNFSLDPERLRAGRATPN